VTEAAGTGAQSGEDVLGKADGGQDQAWPGSKEAAMATRTGHGEAGAGTGGERVTAAVPEDGPLRGRRLLKLLIGSGDKIGLFILPRGPYRAVPS
jgi:hypothetical protein